MEQIHLNREAWLHAGLDNAIRPFLANIGVHVPSVRIGVGNMFHGDKSTELGETKPRSHTHDNVPEITIRMTVTDPLKVLAVLLHESIHAALDSQKHDAQFHGFAVRAGLLGNAKLEPTSEVSTYLRNISEALGEYPAAPIAEGFTRTKQTTRQMGVMCPVCKMRTRVARMYHPRITRCMDNTCYGLPVLY